MTAKKVIAKVALNEIYDWQLDDSMASYAFQILKKPPSELTGAEYGDCRQEALDKLIGGELFYMEALEAGYDVSDDELKKSVDEFNKCFEDPSQISEYMAERGINPQELDAYLKKQAVRDKFVRALMSRIPPITEKEANSYYEKVKEKISHPPKLSFYAAYIENPDDEERESFKTAFANLVSKKMEIPFAEKIMKDLPGLIPSAKFQVYADKPSGELPPGFRNILYGIEEQTFSPVYESPQEISIIFMIKKLMYVPMSEEEGKKEAESYLGMVRLKKIFDAYAASLKEKYGVEIFV